MTEQNNLDSIVQASSTEAFAMILYEDGSSTWEGPAALIAGHPRLATRTLLITSSNGEVTVRSSYEDFVAQNHSEPSVTISADWNIGEAMDGYVTGTCTHEEGTTSELYEYGALDELRPVFVELLLARFKSLVQRKPRVLVAIDASGLSAAEDWLRLYKGDRDVPPSASVVAFSEGGFAIRSTRPCRMYRTDGTEFLFFQ